MLLHQQIVAQQNTVQKRAVVQTVPQVRDNILTNYLVQKSLIQNVILFVFFFFIHSQLFWFQQECMLVDIAQDSEVHHVHLAQKVLSKMATMGVNNALHVNIVMQVHFHFSIY